MPDEMGHLQCQHSRGSRTVARGERSERGQADQSRADTTSCHLGECSVSVLGCSGLRAARFRPVLLFWIPSRF